MMTTPIERRTPPTTLLHAHTGKLIVTGLCLLWFLWGQVYPGTGLTVVEQTWSQATRHAIPRPSSRQPELGLSHLWQQLRAVIDVTLRVADRPHLPDAAELERIQQEERLFRNPYPVEDATSEKIRQRILSGEVREKGLLDLMAPERVGGWRPAPSPRQ